MSSAFMEDPGIEYEDVYDDAELYDDDAELYDDDAESAASRARRKRAQALAAAKRRAAARRRAAVGRGSRLPAPASPRAVVSALREMELRNKVQQDALRSTIAEQNKKIDRAGLATVATLLIGEAFRAFGTPKNTYVRAGIQAMPLLALASGSSHGGIEGMIRHPAVYGGVGMLGLAFLGQQREDAKSAKTIKILGKPQLRLHDEATLQAYVLDGQDKPCDVKVTWKSAHPSVVSINEVSGAVKAEGTGFALITATADDVVQLFEIEVLKDSSDPRAIDIARAIINAAKSESTDGAPTPADEARREQ
ncbi:Ig-like domain-containing protein [Microbispora sp. H10949]|uniref:Ig-like domain-containing protein n=1 Tax=Microbispora sp. H10949 TaxID=2729111 RepID=UPI0015FF863B|nr:Ig-like domain-containing protein [Microbispora sp. H10949]